MRSLKGLVSGVLVLIFCLGNVQTDMVDGFIGSDLPPTIST